MWYIVKMQLCGLIDLLKTTNQTICCILSPLPHHFQETSKDKSPPESVFSSFGVSYPFPQVCPQSLCTETGRLQPSHSIPQVCTRKRATTEAQWVQTRFYQLLIIHTSLYFNCPSHSPEKKGRKIALGIPAHCWKGLCPWRGCADRDQGLALLSPHLSGCKGTSLTSDTKSLS